MERDSITIRSYRVCFSLERRIYRFERWRIPVPWGLPLRGLGYAVAAFVAILVCGRLPVLEALLGTLPDPVRYLLLPVGISYLLTQVKVEGRPAHVAAIAWLRFATSPRWTAGWRPIPAPGSVAYIGDVTFAPDERSPRLRRGRVAGPARVLLRYPGRGRRCARRMVIEQSSEVPMWRGKEVGIPAGGELEVRS